MARHIAWVVAAVLFVPAAGRAAELGGCDKNQAPQRPQAPATTVHKGDKPAEPAGHAPTPKWWLDPKLRAELGITDQQSAAVDLVWQKSLPALREGHQRLDKLEEALSKMSEVADEAPVIAQIDRVENLRAELNKGRTLMIYRMNILLTPEQRAKVKAMYDRREPPRRGPSPR